MSIDFDWSKLDSELEAKVLHLLEGQVSNLSLPSYIKHLKVVDFHFGKVSPQITIQEIGDPDPQFYENEAFELANQELEGDQCSRNNVSPVLTDLPPYAAEHPFSRLAYFNPAFNSPGILSASGLTSPIPESRPSTPMDNHQERDRSNDFQVTAHVSYDGDANLSLEAVLSMNYPNSEFAVLPFKLSFIRISIDAIAVLAKMGKRTHLCFVDTLLHGTGEHASSVIRDLTVESIIGESNKQLLKNVAKVEKFVSEKVKRIIEDELVWPSYITIE
ncbi:hypothetical protein POMI540_4626 [Schizosaccharomyces pombe]|uniref:Mitochondrial distribution and morphology protein 12 n=1 Tax=Schizosaccharomyces pombe (strain 972 / ATCC 24843) TaxID=284812 RepID=MDM12_SCHPO|nr:Mdm10/Mdm12/Mmm1 complex subunit Mdm12 [Schizosaccharomyces pombe]Q92377.1 RecName: Full=Mitochondrial distribution and morphology protein 12; AltName: Full=Mitochondrial inheritance component mdm12 [Schizosaccharomyces pombe 972h-]AAB17957.1 mitochondrial inheritance component Mdm12p [Schizosaccharomyces pombe]CAB57935.1 Mdm10/Mdm12/Mmm1 complex subunit Mdm12 [Schizosaccharomyces pombe]|eukprot:NP_595667.1 Mdm10/Mdm12/Mmm1 complex subunit Mdm12 [Schizosaccharomyces pombe]